MEIITSKENEKIKYIRALNKKSHRDLEQKYLIEGIRFVEEAMNFADDIEQIVYSAKVRENIKGENLLIRAESLNLPLTEVSDPVLKSVADTENPQGVLAIVKMPAKDQTMEEIINQESPLLLIVDGVQDPGNLGTMVRTADAAGISGIITIKGTVDLYNPKTLRSTMGSVFRVPVFPWDEPAELVSLLKEKGINIFTTSARSEKTIYEADFKGPTAVIMGSEAFGAGAELHDSADEAITIPMLGKAESLNVSVATGVILFEAIRQRR